MAAEEPINEENVGGGPSVNYDISMETLKNSTVQMFLKVDYAFSEQQTEMVLKRIKKRALDNERGRTITKKYPPVPKSLNDK